MGQAEVLAALARVGLLTRQAARRTRRNYDHVGISSLRRRVGIRFRQDDWMNLNLMSGRPSLISRNLNEAGLAVPRTGAPVTVRRLGQRSRRRQNCPTTHDSDFSLLRSAVRELAWRAAPGRRRRVRRSAGRIFRWWKPPEKNAAKTIVVEVFPPRIRFQSAHRKVRKSIPKTRLPGRASAGTAPVPRHLQISFGCLANEQEPTHGRSWRRAL